ncbi:MAG: hypothetical protein R8M38_10660 [Mariprofundaceae bacterium]
MKKKSLGLTLAAMIGMAAFVMPSHAEGISVGGDVGIYSSYVWRGFSGTDATSIQGDLAVDGGNGFSANVWFAAPLTGDSEQPVTEFDYTIDYSGEAGDFSYSVGFIYYAYLNQSDWNTGEVYVSAGYGPVSITYYNAVVGDDNGWDGDGYLNLAAGTSVSGFDLGASLGYYMPDVGDSELGHIDLSISKDVTIGDATMTPSLTVSIPLYDAAPDDTNQVVAGVNFAF